MFFLNLLKFLLAQNFRLIEILYNYESTNKNVYNDIAIFREKFC